MRGLHIKIQPCLPDGAFEGHGDSNIRKEEEIARAEAIDSVIFL